MRAVTLSPEFAKHPAYMAVAHIPTALWLLSSLCDLLALAFRANVLVRLAFSFQAIGVVDTLIWHVIRPPAPTPASPEARELAQVHDQLNNALPVLYALSVGLRSGSALMRQRPGLAPVLLSLVGVAGLFASRALARRREALAAVDLTAAAGNRPLVP